MDEFCKSTVLFVVGCTGALRLELLQLCRTDPAWIGLGDNCWLMATGCVQMIQRRREVVLVLLLTLSVSQGVSVVRGNAQGRD